VGNLVRPFILLVTLVCIDITFIGSILIDVFIGDDVVFLDPHLTQNAIDLDEDEFDDSSYHPATCARISFQSMDPSLAVVRYT
jgi:hypothetical protein